MEFDLDEALKIANQALSLKVNRSLTHVKLIVWKGAWHRQEYNEIATKHQYATIYLSQDLAPKGWKTLSDSLLSVPWRSPFRSFPLKNCLLSQR